MRTMTFGSFLAIGCAIGWCQAAAVISADPVPISDRPAPTPSDHFAIPDPLEQLAGRDRVVAKIRDDFEAEMRVAEKAYRDAVQRAAEKRLTAVKARWKSVSAAAVQQLEPDDSAEMLRSAVKRLSSVELGGARPRPRVTVRFGGHTYGISDEPASWQMAKQRCEEMGGHLATIESDKEAEFVGTLRIGMTSAWIGATDDGGEWRWLLRKPCAPVKHLPLTGVNPEASHAANGLATGRRRGGLESPGDLQPVPVFGPYPTSELLHYICEWDRDLPVNDVATPDNSVPRKPPAGKAF